MDVTWKDLLVLVQSNTNVSTTCDAIVEILELDMIAMPDVFHTITFELLLSSEHKTRENASILLNKLGLRFSKILAPLIYCSGTDGDLLRLSDVNIKSILATPGATLQSKLSTHGMPRKNEIQSVYTQEWLDFQRKELRLRMGLDVLADVSNDSDPVSYITEEDVHIKSVMREPAMIMPFTLNVTRFTATEESWLARIVRCMIVGLLSPQWEARHGYSLGLDQLLRGIFPELLKMPHADINILSGTECNILPDFISNDILCCGLCVLLLDRFVDFGSSDSGSVSPVKEVVGKLMACVLRSSHGNEERTRLMWSLTCEMAKSREHWTVTLGGFISMKNLLPGCFGVILDQIWQECVNVVCDGMRSGEEAEVRIAACYAVCAWCRSTLHSSVNVKHTHALEGFIIWIEVLKEGISVADMDFEDPPSLVCAWGDALSSIATASEVLCSHNSERGVEQHLTFVEEILRACTLLVSKLFVHDVKTRRHCLYCVASCMRSLTITANTPSLRVSSDVNDRVQTLRECVIMLLGAITAAGCLSSQRPSVELLLDDTTKSTNPQLPKRRTAANLAKKMIDFSVDNESVDMPSADTNADGSALLPAAAIDLGIVQHDEERDLWACVASRWVGLAFVLYQGCGTLDTTGEDLSDVMKTSIRGIIIAAVEWSPGISAPPRCGDTGPRSARCVFERALETFCRVEAARRPLEAHSTSKLGELVDINQFDYLSVIVFYLGRSLCDICSSSFSQYREEINSCLSQAASSMQNNTHKRKLEPAHGDTLAKKRLFRFVIVPDTVQQPSRIPQVRHSESHGDAASQQWMGARRTLRLLGLIHAEFSTAESACDSNDCSELTTTLTEQLDNLTTYGKDRTPALLRLAVRNQPHDTILSHQNVDPDNSQDANLQLFLSVVTARKLSLQTHSGEEEDFSLLWKLFQCGGVAEVFASQITYFLAKERQVRIADILANGLSQALTRHIAASSAERILLHVLRACTSATKGALNSRFDLVGRELAVVGTVKDSSERFVNDVADVLCMLLLPCVTDISGCNLEFPRLWHVTARVHMLLFPENGCESQVEHRGQLASTLERLTERLSDQIIDAYEILFATALRGLGDRDAAVRQSCVRVFRLLVPLASLAKQTAAHRSSLATSAPPQVPLRVVQVSCELLDSIFTKQSPFQIQKSQHPRDLVVMKGLSNHTNLVMHHKTELSPAQLREYQWEGVSWLTQLRRFGLNGILADEMGLGKSIQALTAVAVLRVEKGMQTGPTLIVCPASVVMHWHDEISKFFSAELLFPVRFSAGLPPAAVSNSGNSVVIVSYEMLRRDVTNGHRSLFKTVVWETVILDEAHLIKNPSAGITRAVCSLQSLHRIALSGTPVQNQVEELWSLMNFLLPDYIGDFKRFRKDVVNPILRSFSAQRELRAMHHHPTSDLSFDATSKSTKKGDPSVKFNQAVEISAVGLNLLRNLHKQVLPFILRRCKDMVAQDLPRKTVVDILCPLSTDQRQLYLAYQAGLRTSDELLEREFATSKEATMGDFADSSSTHMSASELAAKTSRFPQEGAFSSALSDGWGDTCTMNLPSFDEEEKEKPKSASKSKPKTLETLNYLKLLCLHPALVVDASHGRFRARLLESSASSGKLVRLAVLLMDSGVIAREDFHPARRIEDLLQLDGDLMELSDISKSNRGVADGSDEEGEEVNDEDQDQDQDQDHQNQGKESIKQSRDSESDPQAGKESPSAAAHISGTFDEKMAIPLHRCLIFAQHRAALDLVEEHVLQKYFPSIGYERLDGSMDPLKRSAVARKFNEQQRNGAQTSRAYNHDGDHTEQLAQLMTALPAAARNNKSSAKSAEDVAVAHAKDIRILLMTTRSCGLGLNLTAADTVIFLEHDWNPFADLQAMDRVHRIGQTQPVTIYRLLAESTIEARILKLQNMKQSVASQIINEENAGAAGATRGNTAEAPQQFGSLLLGSLLLRPDSAERLTLT